MKMFLINIFLINYHKKLTYENFSQQKNQQRAVFLNNVYAHNYRSCSSGQVITFPVEEIISQAEEMKIKKINDVQNYKSIYKEQFFVVGLHSGPLIIFLLLFLVNLKKISRTEFSVSKIGKMGNLKIISNFIDSTNYYHLQKCSISNCLNCCFIERLMPVYILSFFFFFFLHNYIKLY